MVEEAMQEPRWPRGEAFFTPRCRSFFVLSFPPFSLGKIWHLQHMQIPDALCVHDTRVATYSPADERPRMPRPPCEETLGESTNIYLIRVLRRLAEARNASRLDNVETVQSCLYLPSRRVLVSGHVGH